MPSWFLCMRVRISFRPNRKDWNGLSAIGVTGKLKMRESLEYGLFQAIKNKGGEYASSFQPLKIDVNYVVYR